jgi:hypothetical protein
MELIGDQKYIDITLPTLVDEFIQNDKTITGFYQSGKINFDTMLKAKRENVENYAAIMQEYRLFKGVK